LSVLVRPLQHPAPYSINTTDRSTGTSAAPHSKTARALIRVDSPLSSARAHILAIIHISDFYLLDSPLALHNLSYGAPRIGDPNRTPTRPDAKSLVTLNHTIHFHLEHDSFHADEGVHVELTSPWAAQDGRVLAHSRIFARNPDHEVVLVATCVQEVSRVLNFD
jgi:acyl-CoA thioesterase